MKHWIFLFTAMLCAQNGPPELVNPNQDPFRQDPLERRSTKDARPSARIPSDEVQRSRQDLARLLKLTAEVGKTLDAGGHKTADVQAARKLAEIEKLAKQMRKRITR
ncbi:MAG: hypothetical protein JNK48_09465 [Bryobacterales bacterium]|nr:hypothetical protein [Bryobacterales bacterium]